MKVVTGIVSGEHAFGMLRVARSLVEVDDRIEVAGSADPFVDGLPVSLTGRARVIVISTPKRQEGCAEDLDVVHMSSRDDLLIGCDHPANQDLMVGSRGILIASEHADIVDPFKHDQVTNAG